MNDENCKGGIEAASLDHCGRQSVEQLVVDVADLDIRQGQEREQELQPFSFPESKGAPP